MTPDLINGLFELGGALTLCLNVRALWRDRGISGVHWGPVAFFSAWGVWNLFYYPSLGQRFSFAGGVCVVTVNLVWLGLLTWLTRDRWTPWFFRSVWPWFAAWALIVCMLLMVR